MCVIADNTVGDFSVEVCFGDHTAAVLLRFRRRVHFDRQGAANVARVGLVCSAAFCRSQTVFDC